MGKNDLSLLALMAFIMAGNKSIARALKDARNPAGSQKYNPGNNNYQSIKNIRSPQNYSHSHRPLFYRKII